MVAERNPTVAPKELLRAEAISKRFGPVQALASVDITLLQGEVHVLLGENGAGKSTLAKVLSGIYPDRRDRIWLDGESVYLASVQVARSFGIATVFQELSLIPALTVAENLGLVRNRITSPFRWIKSREDVEAARELLTTLGFDISPRVRVADLAQVQRQIVEIAKAMIQQPRILIMDEPQFSFDGSRGASHFRSFAPLHRARRSRSLRHSPAARDDLSGFAGKPDAPGAHS